MASEKLTAYHGEMTKIYGFKVPLHPKNLSQLVHPWQGYLTAFPGLELSFDDLIAMYENQIVASFEKTYGRELLGDELSCLSFWLLADPERKGWLNVDELTPLMKAFKFTQLF